MPKRKLTSLLYDIIDIDATTLINDSADVNKQDDDGQTPLHEATLNENITAMTLLINNGADVNKQDIYGQTPLRCAACINNIEPLELLINSGADVNKEDIYGQTPLKRAACINVFEPMELLINNGADVNKQDDSGQTPLHQATRKKNIDAIALLEKEVANPRRQCKECKKWLPGSMIRNNQCHPCFWSHARLLFISKREGGTFSDFPNEILREVTKYI